jgi:Na+/melibiose symporter-like transporter
MTASSKRRSENGSVNMVALGLATALLVVLAMPMVSKILRHQSEATPQLTQQSETESK